MKACVLGYQGYGNVGDEAILTGIEVIARDTPVEVIAVFGGPLEIPAFAAARHIHSPRQLPTIAALRYLRRADVLLLSGGGLFHDHWRKVAAKYLAWHVLARLMGVRIVWVGVGVGPLRTRLGRRLVAAAARLANVVTVRDGPSADLIAQLAPGVRVTVAPDPAIANPIPDPVKRYGLGIILRPPIPADIPTRGPALARLLAQVAEASALASRPVALISLAGDADRTFLREIMAHLGDRGGPLLTVEAMPPDPSVTIQRLASLEGIITVRLHGLILAALAGTPAVPIAYDAKVRSWAEELGVADLAIPMARMGEVQSHEVLVQLDLAATPARREAVARKVGELRRKTALLAEAIAGGESKS